MPVVSTIGSPSSTPGNTASPLAATAPSIWPSRAQTPSLAVIVTNQPDGVDHDLTGTCLEVSITYGLDVGISSATVVLTENPNLSKYSTVRLYCGAGTVITSTPNVNGIPLRFTGLFLETRADLWPGRYVMVCRGNLYLADQLRLPPFIIPGTATVIPASLLDNAPVGILLFTNIAAQNPVVNGLLPGPGTDAQAIVAMLDLVRPLGLDFDPADIGGTTATFGTIVPLTFLWPPYRSVLDMIHQFDQICLGFRTYETYGGRIVRSQMFGYPYGPSDTTFTEGVDIREGSSATRSVLQLCNAAFVEGAALPDGGSGIINHYLQESNPFQGSGVPIVDQFSSQWIEASDLVTNSGLNAHDVASWRLSERNRELVTGQWLTFRDDILFPGHVISIVSPHTAVTEPVWMQRIDVRMTAQPLSFSQTISGLGGGDPGYATSNPYTPPQIIY